MTTPIKMMVVHSTTGKGMSLRCVVDGDPTRMQDLRDALASAGYKAGDAVELVQAGCCKLNGEPCEKHADQVHGQEAEELRAGIERTIAKYYVDPETEDALQRLLDRVDARDSLAFMEARDKLVHKAKDKRIAELEAKNSKLRSALERTVVNLSADRSWCQICRTEDLRPSHARDEHPHDAKCPLAKGGAE